MKIFDADALVSERIKVQPVTNAEFERMQKDMSTDLLDLPLEYHNILVPGNVLSIEKSVEKYPHRTTDYIVISADNWPYALHDSISLVLVEYDLRYHNPIRKWTNFENDFKDNFPRYNVEYFYYKIINIRGTIPEREFIGMKDADDLKKIYEKHNLAYHKI